MAGYLAFLLSFSILLWPSPLHWPYDVLSDYHLTHYVGWTVLIHRHYVSSPSSHRRVWQIVQAQLTQSSRVFPAHARLKLQQIRIWIEYTSRCKGNAGVFRTGTPLALQRRGLHPAKANAIEICGAQTFYETAYFRPAQLLHELAHAYHARFVALPQQQEILRAYQNALDKGLYRNVPTRQGPTAERAYAISSVHEYFAELSEMFFAKGPTYPYDRQRLQRYDPVGYQMIQKVWGVSQTPPRYGLGYGYSSYRFAPHRK